MSTTAEILTLDEASRKGQGRAGDGVRRVDDGTTAVGGDPTALRTRFRQVLTVLQQVHDCKRVVANQILAAECGTTWRYVLRLSTRGLNVSTPRTVDLAGLARLEARYARSLRLLKAYESSCARETYYVGMHDRRVMPDVSVTRGVVAMRGAA